MHGDRRRGPLVTRPDRQWARWHPDETPPRRRYSQQDVGRLLDELGAAAGLVVGAGDPSDKTRLPKLHPHVYADLLPPGRLLACDAVVVAVQAVRVTPGDLARAGDLRAVDVRRVRRHAAAVVRVAAPAGVRLGMFGCLLARRRCAATRPVAYALSCASSRGAVA